MHSRLTRREFLGTVAAVPVAPLALKPALAEESGPRIRRALDIQDFLGKTAIPHLQQFVNSVAAGYEGQSISSKQWDATFLEYYRHAEGCLRGIAAGTLPAVRDAEGRNRCAAAAKSLDGVLEYICDTSWRHLGYVGEDPRPMGKLVEAFQRSTAQFYGARQVRLGRGAAEQNPYYRAPS